MRTIIAVFDSLYSTSLAVSELEQNGLTRDLMNIFWNSERNRAANGKKRAKIKLRPEVEMDGQNPGARIGSGIGIAAGIAAGTLAALGVIPVPYLSEIVAAGLLAEAAALVGGIGVFTAAGSLTGLLIGGAFGLGIPEEEMRSYARAACKENVLLAVQADWNEIDTIIELIGKHAPLSIEERAYIRHIDEQIRTNPPVKNTAPPAKETKEHH